MGNKLEARIKRLEELIATPVILTVILQSFADGEVIAYQDGNSIKTIRRTGEFDAELLERAEAEAIGRGSLRNGICTLKELRAN